MRYAYALHVKCSLQIKWFACTVVYVLCSSFGRPQKCAGKSAEGLHIFFAYTFCFWYSSFNVFSFGNIGTAHAQKVHTSAYVSYVLHRFFACFSFFSILKHLQNVCPNKMHFFDLLFVFVFFPFFWASANSSYARFRNWCIFVCLFFQTGKHTQ